MKSLIAKRSVIINGQKTSVSLEEPFWVELKSIAAGRRVHLQRLISEIAANKQHANLSSALRLFVLANCRSASAETVAQRPASEGRARQWTVTP